MTPDAVENSPHDLLQHRCVNYRHGSGEVYRWELDKDDQSLVVAVAISVLLVDLLPEVRSGPKFWGGGPQDHHP